MWIVNNRPQTAGAHQRSLSGHRPVAVGTELSADPIGDHNAGNICQSLLL
jgi:hypothetical protein